MSLTQQPPKPNRWSSLVAFLVIVVGGGLLIGTLNIPGPWYHTLSQPPLTPPDWVFGPAWTLLYVLIAIAGWRTAGHSASALPIQLWTLQLFLNFIWSPVFFNAEAPVLALAVLIALLVTVLNLARITWHEDRTTSLLLLPYVLWLCFATYLNAGVVALN